MSNDLVYNYDLIVTHVSNVDITHGCEQNILLYLR